MIFDNMINNIMTKFGFVRCRVCSKWTEPSIIEENICSWKCYNLEKVKK